MLGVLPPELSQLCPFVLCLCAPLADIREQLARFHSCFFVLRTKFGYKMQERMRDGCILTALAVLRKGHWIRGDLHRAPAEMGSF